VAIGLFVEGRRVYRHTSSPGRGVHISGGKLEELTPPPLTVLVVGGGLWRRTGGSAAGGGAGLSEEHRAERRATWQLVTRGFLPSVELNVFFFNFFARRLKSPTSD